MQGVGNNVTSNASLRTKVLVWLREIPLVTRATFLVCVGVFLLELLTTGYMPFVRAFCVSSRFVLHDMQRLLHLITNSDMKTKNLWGSIQCIGCFCLHFSTSDWSTSP